MNKLVIMSLLVASAFAQAPTGVTGSMYEPSFPDYKALIQWMPVPGAQSYNVYRLQTEDSTNVCPATDSTKPGAVEFPNITGTSFLDDPYPTFASIPVTGAWRQRAFCYWVETNINNAAVGEAAPVMVWIGDSGYLTLVYFTACSNGTKVVPFPYMNEQIIAHFYYTDSAGAQHEIPTINLHNAYPYLAGDPLHSYNQEWEWKIPVTALDGTIVPLTTTGKYTYTISTPDAGKFTGSFMPPYNLDMSYYNQRSLFRVANTEWCPITVYPELNYDFSQNVAQK